VERCLASSVAKAMEDKCEAVIVGRAPEGLSALATKSREH
jgi:hypothetical protein